MQKAKIIKESKEKNKPQLIEKEKPWFLNPAILISIIVIIISTVFATRFALHSDIIFHTDIARDFLLMEDVVRNKPITLIGPRSGGIPGVFHGPLWTYLNIPAFILGNGNPAVVGWFWVLLYAVNLYVVFKIGKNFFNQEVGMIAAALTSIATSFDVSSFFNPFGAVMMSPLFLYFIYKYIKENKPKDLLIGLFILGLIIQFQMAFGVPILIITIPILVFRILRNRKYLHIFALAILLIPLSTFILFDLKHQFLQTKSIVNYLTGKENIGKTDKNTIQIFQERVKSMQTDGVSFLTKNNQYLFAVILIVLGYSIFITLKRKEYYDKRTFFFLFFYYFIGYWLTTVLYKGFIWSYYFWPLLSLVILAFSAGAYFIDKKIFIIIFVIFAYFNINFLYNNYYKSDSYFGNDGGSWQFHNNVAKQIYLDAPNDFGYYVFTDDQFGYSSRYAMSFNQYQNKSKKSYPYEKRSTTYLIIFPSGNPTINDGWWKENKVKINKKPVKIFTFKGSNMRIEKYILSSEEIADISDDTLIHTLIFR